MPVQKRVNIALLSAYTLKGQLARLALHWHLGTWIPGEFPPLTDMKGSLCLNCFYKQYNYATLCIPSGSLKSGYMPGRDAHMISSQ